MTFTKLIIITFNQNSNVIECYSYNCCIRRVCYTFCNRNCQLMLIQIRDFHIKYLYLYVFYLVFNEWKSYLTYRVVKLDKSNFSMCDTFSFVFICVTLTPLVPYSKSSILILILLHALIDRNNKDYNCKKKSSVCMPGPKCIQAPIDKINFIN